MKCLLVSLIQLKNFLLVTIIMQGQSQGKNTWGLYNSVTLLQCINAHTILYHKVSHILGLELKNHHILCGMPQNTESTQWVKHT